MWRFEYHHFPDYPVWTIKYPDHQFAPDPLCIHGHNTFVPCTACISLNIATTRRSQWRRWLTFDGCMHGLDACWRCPRCELSSDAELSRFDDLVHGPRRVPQHAEIMLVEAGTLALELRNRQRILFGRMA